MKSAASSTVTEPREAFGGVRCIPALLIFCFLRQLLRSEELKELRKEKKEEMKSVGIRAHSKRFARSLRKKVNDALEKS